MDTDPQTPNITVEKVATLLAAIKTGRVRITARPADNAVFRPRMDIYADPDSPNIIATFELPGVKTSDVSISVNKGTLIIQGERLNRYRSNPRHPSLRGVSQGNANEKSTARFSPYRELRYGHFHRKLRLPSDAETSGITATLADGLLTVSWPRSPLHQQVEHAGHPTSSVRSEPVSN